MFFKAKKKKELSLFKKIGSRLQPSKLLKCCLFFMRKEEVLLHLKSNICDFQWKLLLHPSKSSARKSTIMVTTLFDFLRLYGLFWDFMELEPGVQFSSQNENFLNANKKSLEVLSQILCSCLSMKKFFSFNSP